MNRSREHGRVLLQKARDDAWMLRRLAEPPDAPQWGLGFHAQQAVEKAVKAVLTAASQEYPRTHDLARLFELLEEAGRPLPPEALRLASLTEFGAPLRYESLSGAEDEALDRSWAIEAVERTIAWAERELG